MGISSKRGQMKYVRLLLWGMYEEMAHSFFKVGQCPLGHNWSTYFATYHCTLEFPKYIYKIIFKTLIHSKHCQRHNDPKALSTFTKTTPLVQSRSFNKLWNLGHHGFCFVPKWLLFSSGINNMAFVLFQHQQHGFVLFQCQQHGCQNWQQLVRQGEVAWLFGEVA